MSLGAGKVDRAIVLLGTTLFLGLGVAAGCGTGIYEDFADAVQGYRHGYDCDDCHDCDDCDDDFFAFGFDLSFLDSWSYDDFYYDDDYYEDEFYPPYDDGWGGWDDGGGYYP